MCRSHIWLVFIYILCPPSSDSLLVVLGDRGGEGEGVGKRVANDQFKAEELVEVEGMRGKEGRVAKSQFKARVEEGKEWQMTDLKQKKMVERENGKKVFLKKEKKNKIKRIVFFQSSHASLLGIFIFQFFDLSNDLQKDISSLSFLGTAQMNGR